MSSFIKNLKKSFNVEKVKGGWHIVYDPEKGSFEEQWFDCFERERWEKAVTKAYYKLRTCRYVKSSN